MSAKVAQLVEHLTRNEKVGGPIPPFGSMKEENEKRIAEIESIMQSGDFWQDKIIAQKNLRQMEEKEENMIRAMLSLLYFLVREEMILKIFPESYLRCI
jgi:hypothetical protein